MGPPSPHAAGHASPLAAQSAAHHPLQGEGQALDFSRVALPHTAPRLSAESVPSGVAGFQMLALSGSWRPLMQTTKDTLAASDLPMEERYVASFTLWRWNPKPPAAFSIERGARQASFSKFPQRVLVNIIYMSEAAARLAASAYHVLALTKLRMYGAALDEVRALGEWDQPKYTAKDGGSLVPFALRYLAAELPYRLGQAQVGMDALYALMQYCKEEASRCQTAAAGGPSQAHDREGAVRWTRRQEMVLYTALTHHLQSNEFGVVVQWMEWLLQRHPRDVVVLSRVGCVLLQMGDIEGAERAFTAAEAVKGDPESVRKAPRDPALLHALLNRNRGLLLFAQKDLSGAQAAFSRALEQDPADVISINNCALCMMYQRNLMGATRFLEESLRSDPVNNMEEPMILNLCSMYDLAWASGTENKRKLSSWLGNIAPDDFDLNCTRL